MKAATLTLGQSCCAQLKVRYAVAPTRSPNHPILAARPSDPLLPIGVQQRWAAVAPTRHSGACAASKNDRQQQQQQQQPAAKEQEEPGAINVVSIGITVLWLCLAAYAFGLSPNQTPYRDQIFIKLLTGISQDSTFSVNQVYFSLFNIIGLYTFFFQCLLIPAGRSGNKVPAWPFVVLSYGFGAFALLPYFALWRPVSGMKLPLPAEELEGWNKLAMKGAETKVLPALALAASVYLLYNAFSADGATWAGYLNLFEESRLVHISTIDCGILACLAPFWMSNDAELRGWKDREKLLPLLSVLPVVGPATYLLLRPKTGEEEQE